MIFHPTASTFLNVAMGFLAILVAAGFLTLLWTSTRSLKSLILAALSVAVIMAVQFIAASIGYLRQWDRIPPPLFQIVIWTLLVTVIFSRSKPAAAIAQRTCWPVLIATQAFRLPLELTMHHAASTGVMPVQMSYSGLNFDILTGLSAIVLSAALAFGRAGRTAIRIWNILGFLLLVNVVAIAIASLPLFHAFGPEKLNTWVTYPPFIWLPGLLVPAALLGHLLVWRKLSNL